MTSNELKQGDIIYVKLDLAKGYETKKNRPCLVVSNNYFNNDKKHKFVYGTVILQHLRSIDSRERCKFGSIANASDVLPQIRECIQMSI